MRKSVIFEIGWNACINCGACIAVCPHEAGFVSDFDTIAVNKPCDIACMKCEDICPVSTIQHRDSDENNSVYFANKNPGNYPGIH